MGVLDLGAHLPPSPQFCRAVCCHGQSTQQLTVRRVPPDPGRLTLPCPLKSEEIKAYKRNLFGL